MAACALAAIGLAGPAAAQGSNTCQGRASVVAVYQNAVSGGGFQYFFQLRNATNGTMTIDVSFSGFPSGVTVPSPSMSQTLAGRLIRSNLPIGRGSWNMPGNGVTYVYDVPAGSGPTIRLTNCRAA